MKKVFGLLMTIVIIIELILIYPEIHQAIAQLKPETALNLFKSGPNTGQPYAIGAWYFIGWSARTPSRCST